MVALGDSGGDSGVGGGSRGCGVGIKGGGDGDGNGDGGRGDAGGGGSGDDGGSGDSSRGGICSGLPLGLWQGCGEGGVDIGLVEKPFQHTCLLHLQDCVVNGDYLARIARD